MRRRNRPLVFLASALRLTLTLAVAAQPVLAATVAAALCGDVNGDGVVDIGDALVVAEFDVGDRQCSQLTHPEACDVNGDGACNIDDALRIAQCDVGLISCGFTCGPFTCPSTTSTTTTTRPGTCSGACPIHTVFLILMENHDWSSIKGSPSAPYINDTLLPIASHAEQYYNPRCVQHVRPYSELGTDLINDTAARYNFITPDLCHDMHDACAPLNDPVQQGDTWLSTEVPKILASQAYANDGALFILWDEAVTGDGPIGMIVLSPKAKGGGYQNTIHYTHSSTLRTVEEILGVAPLLGDAANATDLSDLFVSFP